jgi:hypothetical protein
MTKESVLEKVKEFERLFKENRNLRSCPAYRYEKGEEYTNNIYRQFGIIREEIINLFHITGDKYNHGNGLDAQQKAERYITVEFVNKYYDKYFG